jgi:deoxyribodipyrimidine photo-lyase
MMFPSSRAGALEQLAEFVPNAVFYARDRNRVDPGHPGVSKLSPAIRHRLLTEDEVAAAVISQHRFARVEKFIQEVYWRRYWKSWLSLRPQVWADYREESGALDVGKFPAIAKIAALSSGNPVIDHFTRELMETGYLHNHARMWYAAWWIHAAGLPWQAGADFFLSHLLDGDPASNTLSWRWVAGLQTPGKTYLARRSNLEKYMAPSLLDPFAGGWSDFENPAPRIPASRTSHAVTCPYLAETPGPRDPSAGIWIHEEDLSPETSPLGGRKPVSVIVTGHLQAWDSYHFPETKRRWLSAALEDTAARASSHWQCPVSTSFPGCLETALCSWAKHHGCSEITALRPDPGPLADKLPRLVEAFAGQGVTLILQDRPRDLMLRPLATAGFFKFWETIQKRGLLPGSTQPQAELFPF